MGIIPVIDVHQNNGVLVTTSRNIAEVFKKEHRNVIRDIRTLLENNPDKDFGQLNFEQSSYLNEQNKEQPEFLLTRDGTPVRQLKWPFSLVDELKQALEEE